MQRYENMWDLNLDFLPFIGWCRKWHLQSSQAKSIMSNIYALSTFVWNSNIIICKQNSDQFFANSKSIFGEIPTQNVSILQVFR